ncbi:DUF4097 family beta strand repeat-containing protein [Fodinibius saliphilus]|uniref:DUF4097 family beta strand repeat-containing protein n=1 Tax=Fodinibius saliphilus TaxID=1920650 RepID=UPI0011098C5F|nr:DUF4097 family beta strand repeat-containing protein [Fodinibius saliphilus]
MRALKYITLLLFASLFPMQIMAQEQIAVPLSKPGEAGILDIGIVRGSITVTGYDGEEVLVRYQGDRKKEHEVTKNGLRKISTNSSGFEVSEENNKVEISGASPMQSIDFEVTVPRNFSLNLSTVNGGGIHVENVQGEMDISNVNGEVSLTNVGGAALVNTVNGDIKAIFQNVSPNSPMAFSNLNGDIDITLPAKAKITAKMKSEWGEVFTDFEIDINRNKQKKVKSSADDGVYKVSVNNWIYGDINGGGPEYHFKSMRGNIYIRKK